MVAAYSLLSTWRVPAQPGAIWTEIDRMLYSGESPPWWPSVRISPHPAAVQAGEQLGMIVRSPLGYTLRAALVLTAVEPGRLLAAETSGDLHGSGELRIEPEGDECVLRFRWDVATRPRWMNAAAPLLRPVFAAAHARVMAAGERGLRAALEA